MKRPRQENGHGPKTAAVTAEGFGWVGSPTGDLPPAPHSHFRLACRDCGTEIAACPCAPADLAATRDRCASCRRAASRALDPALSL